MPGSIIQRSFAGGELAPALHARADQAHYISGLRRCRNFMVLRHGGVANRAGFRFVEAAKTTSATVQILPYVSEVPDESLLLEQGVGYIRFFQQGAAVQIDLGDIDAWDVATNFVAGDLVQDGGIVYYCTLAHTGHAPPNATYWHPFTGLVYEVPVPVTHLMNWVQSGRVITFTHKDEAPFDLVFEALTRWLVVPIVTASSMPAPAGLGLVVGGAGTRSYGYVVTALAADSYEESPASAQAISVVAGTPTPAAPHVLTWTPVAGAAEYNVYADPFGNGTYGYIGTATGAASFKDAGVVPDFTLTPPVSRVLFNAAGGYPHVCAYYQQRRIFGYTNDNPDSVFGSRIGCPSNFGISSPLQDDDSLTFRIAGNHHNPVRRIVALKSLIILTDSGEWTVGEPKTPLTPSSIPADQETYVGVSDVRPVIVGNAILYVQARGSIVCDLRFDQQVEGLAGRDLSLFAAHLFEGYTLADLDYQQTPQSIVWAVRSDGTLLGLTYVREQDVWGWHRHDSGAGARFEHVAVVPEAGEDALYVLVRRTIGGVAKRYIERLERRLIQTATFDADAFFVDSGLTYSGAPVGTVTGLAHLEGQVVAVVADGSVIFDGDPAAAPATLAAFTVTAGVIHLPAGVTASTIHVGLPIRFAEIELLDLDVQGSAVRDRQKRPASVTLLVDASSRSFWAGPDSASLIQYQRTPAEPASDEYTGNVEMNLTSSFAHHGRVFIRQTDPLPLTILAAIPNEELGG